MRFLDSSKLYFLAAVPVLIGVYVLLQQRRRAYTMRFTNLDLLATVAPRRPGWRRHASPVIMLLALVFLIGALARPTIIRAVPREQAGIILVLDVSLSMAATDITPDRITAAKEAATEFVHAVPSEIKIGVVGFSELASLVSPLGRDRAQTELAIDSLHPTGGTAIGEGLFTALDEISRVTKKAGESPASVLLLSDGEWNRGRSPDDAATLAQQMGVKVFTVGLGTIGATLDVGGREIPVDVNEDQLRAIAETTSGTYVRSGDAESLRAVYRSLGSRLGSEKERQEATAIAAGIAAALLVLGGLISLIWFQRIP
jgi:Ca-activated chloride channel homolog